MKVIVFDFWGTIMEHGVRPSPIKQVKQLIAPRMSYPNFVMLFEQTFMTKPFNDLYEGFTEVLKNFGKKPRQDLLDKLVAIWNKNKLFAKPFPDAIDTLRRLRKKYKLAIIANTDSLSTPMVIEKYGIDKEVDLIVYSFEEGKLKSSGELIKRVMKEFNVDEKDILMVGDSLQSDIYPMKNRGIKAILIDRRDTRDYEEKINSLEELQ